VAVGSLGTDESGDVTERTIRLKNIIELATIKVTIKRPSSTYLLQGTKFEFDV
jgi:hypothetical protein